MKLLISFCLLSISCGCLSLAQVLPTTTTIPSIYTHGRVVSRLAPGQPAFQLPLFFTWPGSALFTYWTGTTITVTISNISFWQPEIDGIPQPKFFSPADTTASYSFSAANAGTHTFTLTKLNEARAGTATVTGLSVDPAGSFLQNPGLQLPSWITSGRRIEVFGDSYTVGYGNNVMQSNCTSVQPVYQQATDPLLSPVPLVADHFGADYHLTAWSASGLTASLQGSPNLPDFWRRGDATNPSSSWNFATWQPQVVLNAIGSNDVFAYSPDSADQFAREYANFSLSVQSVYPNASYIVVSYAPDTQMFGDPNQAERYQQYMAAAFNAVKASGIKASFLQLSGVNQSANSCTGHPDAIGDASMARDMIDAINTLQPW
ncbi:hypothetical protein WJX74_000808 [Apatococcus lobatus]|uniref:Uncharacterized protein n=2 Tax=Apatococcus TaxID=904362 RepID=A0AAW1SSC8_9CHLO